MNKPKVSVIIPVYNVERYLAQCLDSVIHQTWQNLEIIIVNDGSSDSSADIIEDFAKKDSRIIVVSQPNGGLSSARNKGIMNSTGDYVGFVDSDDWLEPNAIENLYNGFSVSSNVLLTNGMIVQHDELSGASGLMRPGTWKREEPRIIEAADWGKALLSESSSHYVWSKLFKRDVFNLTMFRDGRNDEDTLFTFELAKAIRFKDYRIVDIEYQTNHYRVRPNSICTDKRNPLIPHRIANLNEILDYCRSDWPELAGYVEQRKIASLMWYLRNAMVDSEVPKSEWRPLQKLLRETVLSEALAFLARKEQARYILMRWFPNIYRCL
ncbi:MAG: glycosyltransferase family 2 protein [Candidatus Cryptobacteroides sp.]